MPRNYRHIQQYEQEMIELKEKGWTVKAIGEKYGLSYEQAHGFFKRYNRKQKKLAEGIEVNGRAKYKAVHHKVHRLLKRIILLL